MQRQYPSESHYAFVSNSPLLFADKDGKDKVVTITVIGKDGKSRTIERRDKDYFKYEAEYRTYTIHDGIPGKEFLAGYKENVYETYVIDLNNPANNSFTTRTEVVDKFNWQLTYYGNMLFSGGDQSSKGRYGYMLYGSGHDMEEQKRNASALPGSESLDVDKFISALQAYRDLPTKEYSNPGFLDFAADTKWKEFLEKADNFVKGLDALATANGGSLPTGMKDLPAGPPGDYKANNATIPVEHRHLDTIFRPTDFHASGATGVLSVQDSGKYEIIYVPKSQQAPNK